MGRNRAALTMAGVLSAIALTGFAFGEVKLRVDRPLIDLSENLLHAETGDADTFLTETAGETETPADAVSGEESKSAAKEEAAPASIEIRIAGDSVFLNEVLYARPEAMLRKIAALREESVAAPAIVLIDDYADYQTYVGTRERLREAGLPLAEEARE